MGHEHTGIGHYFCGICRDWAWGQKGRAYLDVIHVYKDRGVAYCAYMSGVPREDYPAVQTWETNLEVPLARIPGAEKLPPGPQDPWPRFWAPDGMTGNERLLGWKE